MTRMIRIAPSILSADFADLGREIAAVEAQGADWIHVDVMDGHFVPNLTFGPTMCTALRRHIRTHMDVHLMIAPVDPMIAAFAASGADRLTIHVEAGPHLHRSLQAIRAAGPAAGVAINPATPVAALEHVLDLVDVVCVMGVNPGFGGQSLIRGQLDKTRAIRALIGSRPILVEFDGGVSVDTARDIVAAGADVLVAGAAVFGGGSADAPQAYGANIAALRAAANRAFATFA